MAKWGQKVEVTCPRCHKKWMKNVKHGNNWIDTNVKHTLRFFCPKCQKDIENIETPMENKVHFRNSRVSNVR